MQPAGLGQALSGFHTSKHNTACKQLIVPLTQIIRNYIITLLWFRLVNADVLIHDLTPG